MDVKTISEALMLYGEHLRKVNSNNAKNVYDLTVTSLSRYTMPAWGYASPKGRKPTKAEKKVMDEALSITAVEKLADALKAQEEVFKLVKATAQQRYTYRSKLKAFVSWLKQQDLLPTNNKTRNNHAPKMQYGYGGASYKRLTARKLLPSYALRPEQASAQLIAEMEKFYDFLTKNRYPGRRIEAIKPNVAKKYVADLYRILGWFLKSRRVDSSNTITLDTLVPKVKLKRVKNKEEALIEAEQAAAYLDEWLCDFLDFLEVERGASARTLKNAISAINLLVKYHYHAESEEKDFVDIPAMKIIRSHHNEVQVKCKKQKPVVDSNIKWLEMPDVFNKIVKPLRLECRYRNGRRALRNDKTIAASFQRFLIFGVLTFIPPRRQQEWREVKIGLSCLLTDKPKNLMPGQFIHPLPEDRDKDKYYGYLCKDIDGKWYKDTTPESYKTGKVYGYQKIEIRNVFFQEENKYFYDYLEAFLYGYFRDPKGEWISGGQLVSSDVVHRSGQWHNLRMSLNPKHNFLFTQTRTGTPFDTTHFARVVQHASHRLTGQLLTPHLLRDIYATWFLDHGYTEDQIESLAYAMAHSVQMLRATYDKRQSDQRIRPISEEMDVIVDSFVNGESLYKSSEKGHKSKRKDVEYLQKNDESLKKLLSILTPQQRAEIGLD